MQWWPTFRTGDVSRIDECSVTTDLSDCRILPKSMCRVERIFYRAHFVALSPAIAVLRVSRIRPDELSIGRVVCVR